MRYGVSAAVGAMALLASGDALAALEMTVETQDAGSTTPRTQAIYATEDRLKVDTDKTTFVYRADTGKFYNIMKDKHAYMEIDPKQIGAQMNAMQATMEQQLKALPEAQRKQVEAMMAQRSGGASADTPPTITYEKAGQSKTIGSWSCQVYHQKTDGQLTADTCIAPLSEIGAKSGDMDVFKSLSATMQSSVPPMFRRTVEKYDFAVQSQQIGFEGFPVETVTYSDGKPRMTTTIKSLTHGDVPADAFDIPAGYTKQDMMGGHGPAPAAN